MCLLLGYVHSICYIIEGNIENEGKGKEYPRRGHEGQEEE